MLHLVLDGTEVFQALDEKYFHPNFSDGVVPSITSLLGLISGLPDVITHRSWKYPKFISVNWYGIEN